MVIGFDYLSRRDYGLEYPSCVDLAFLQAQTLFLTGSIEEASAQLLVTLRLDPDNTQAKELRIRVKAVQRLKTEGNISFKANQWSNSVISYSDALEVEMVLHRSILHCADLLSVYHQAVQKRPEEGSGGIIRATLLSNRAAAYTKVGRDSSRPRSRMLTHTVQSVIPR